MLVSVGERISCALAAMAIHDLGHEAISLTGSQAGIVTDTVHGKAKIVEVRARRIHEALDEGTIVLVAGFQGVSTAFEVTTLGRGGSDTTAVALAAALGADHCEIYTDVAASSRPTRDSSRRRASSTRLTFDEMLEMARSGAGVLATRSIEVARSHNVQAARPLDLRGRATARGSRRRTRNAREGAHLRRRAPARGDRVPRRRRHAGAALRRARGGVRERRHDRADERRDRLLRPGRGQGGRRPRARRARRLLEPRDDLGKVSLVGAGMKSHPGVAAKTFATLEAAGIEAPIVSTSPIKIACHVAAADVDQAVQALHEAFDLG